MGEHDGRGDEKVLLPVLVRVDGNRTNTGASSHVWSSGQGSGKQGVEMGVTLFSTNISDL